MALGLEHVDRIHATIDQTERAGVRRVELDAAVGRCVDAAQVDCEVAVDERPDVVVSGEIERWLLARIVGERIVQLAGEREVVEDAGLVHVGLRGGSRSVPAQPVEREERLVVELVDVGAGPLLVQRQRRGLAGAIEEYLLRKHVRRARTGIAVPRAEVGGGRWSHWRQSLQP